MKKWLRKILKMVAVEILRRDAEIVNAVSEALDEVYDNLAELSDGSTLLSYQDTYVRADGSILQENNNTITTTTFSKANDGSRVITEIVTDKSGVFKYEKTTTISKNKDTQKSEIKEVYRRE